MFMVIKEDVENLIFKCEKLIEANKIKYNRNKKELKTLKKAIENYEVNEDNKIVYNEICNRYTDLLLNQDVFREENKYLKTAIRKLNSLIVTDDIIEDVIDPEDIEIGQLE